MQDATTLIGRVQDLVKDGSFGPSFIIEKLNDGLAEVVQIAMPPDLVELDIEVDVFVGEKFASMPANFYGPRLLGVRNTSTQMPCEIFYRFSDFAQISRRFPSGEIRAVCLKGRKLHVAGIPSATTTLEVTYLREPEILTGESDTGEDITYLPFRLGEQAIVNYAAWRIYEHIEDGVDGKKVNTDKFRANFLDSTAKILDYFGMEAREKEPETVQDRIGLTEEGRRSQNLFVGNL